MNTATTSETQTSTRLRLRQRVAQVSDRFAEDAGRLAARLESYKDRSSSKPKIALTQVRGLENVAYTTLKVSDITDYVKKQIGRRRWPLELGEDLLAAFDRLQPEVRRIAKDMGVQDKDLPRQTHLLLCREYVKHLAAHFIYQRRLRGEEEEER